METDTKNLCDMFDLIVLNELLKKELLTGMGEYVKNFEKTATFNYAQAVSCIDYSNFIKEKSSLTFIQFQLNLELLAIKLYKVGELDKETLRKTKLKLLRQAFAHRKSADILSGKDRMVLFAGVNYDFNTLYVANLADKGADAKHIEYPYSGYVEVLLTMLGDDYKNRKDTVRQLQALNAGLVEALFPNRPYVDF